MQNQSKSKLFLINIGNKAFILYQAICSNILAEEEVKLFT